MSDDTTTLRNRKKMLARAEANAAADESLHLLDGEFVIRLGAPEGPEGPQIVEVITTTSVRSRLLVTKLGKMLTQMGETLLDKPSLPNMKRMQYCYLLLEPMEPKS